jgi:hypothetical protein
MTFRQIIDAGDSQFLETLQLASLSEPVDYRHPVPSPAMRPLLTQQHSIAARPRPPRFAQAPPAASGSIAKLDDLITILK